MISYYDPDSHSRQTIRVTFMKLDYVGHISFEVEDCRYGEAFDLSFLTYDNQDSIDKYVENDCKFHYDDEDGMYVALLNNEAHKDWDEMVVVGDEADFKDMVVSVEFM